MTKFLLEFALASRNVVRQKRRSLIAVAAVSLGIAASILAGGFTEWIFQELRESTIRSHLGHLQIVRPGYHDGGKADPYVFLLPATLPDLEAMIGSQRIAAIVPRLSFSGLISHGDSTLSFTGEGVDPKEQAVFGNALQISVGSGLSLNDPRGVIIGEGLARNLGINVGDTVVLLANTVARGVNAVEVVVRGLFSTVVKAYDDSALRMPIETARNLLRTNGSHVWIVLLDDTEQTDMMLGSLRNKLEKDGYEIVPWYRLSDFYNKTVTLFTKQIEGIRLIIAVIILLTISNTITINVMERTGEIGTARALGIKRSGIIRLFLSEGAVIGCVGAILGLILGPTLALIISGIGIPMPPPPGMTRTFTGQIIVTWNIVWQSLALGVATTLIASLYPAWKASRLQIVDALRHNR